MGESIAEGTIVRWIKKVGDRVDRDEPLFEISTDKVDAEIPSPAAGVLLDITVREGETVPVDSVVATIGDAGEQPAASPVTARVEASPAPSVAVAATPAKEAAAAPAVAQASTTHQPAAVSSPRGKVAGSPPATAGRSQRSSPLVRRIAKEHGIDISQVHGTGAGGRVNKHDMLRFIEQRGGKGAPAPAAAQVVFAPGEDVELQPLSIVRKKIAEHMVLSRRTSAHVHTVFHVNFSAAEKLRQLRRGDYERQGVRLTYMAFITRAVVKALQRHPLVNASFDGTNIVYKKHINIGIAVALETGLIVPVIKDTAARSVLDLSRAIADVAERARTKRLKPEEVHGGTFTITNPGQFGAQFGMPIINQPQMAILGVGTIEKRPIVIDDAIAVRTMGYLTLGFDHRIIDGAVADAFMADVRHGIEHFDPSEL
jgi:2-oxoglutarate dehydrogenase E2 component (dihydrolipoamide succinyltransferase)